MKRIRYEQWAFVLFSFWFVTTDMKATSVAPEKEPLIVYEVFVRSFCDSNGDGIGDLPGLISKLDYIRELGTNAIWIMPVHPSPSYHQYDVTDYRAIHPELGTMEDMDHLIREVHRRGMKIIFDLVINHTSSEHDWFKASSSSKESPYRDYYVWKDYETVKDAIFKKSSTFDSDNLTQWHEWPGNEERYYGFFWKGMPDLNFDHQPLRKEVYEIGKFWVEKGIDGFRLDAAKHIYPDDEIDKTRQFWEEFTATMRTYKSDILIVGEVWASPDMLASMFKGLPSLFNFELTKAIPESILSGHARTLIHTYVGISSAYQNAGTPFDDAILLSNHDMNRIRSTVGGDIEKSKLAAAILLTLPGTSYIYYGEEIGMMGVKPDIHLREPFVWDEQTHTRMTWQETKYSLPDQVTPVDQQISDASSIYHHYKKWIDLRKAHPAIASGQPQFQDLNDEALMAWIVRKKSKTYWVVHNLSADEKSIVLQNRARLLSAEGEYHVRDQLQVGPWGSVVLMIQK